MAGTCRDAPRAGDARAGPTGPGERTDGQARFHRLTPDQARWLAAQPVPCTAVVVTCFREDGNILMLQPAGTAPPWDLPHGVLPRGADAAGHAGRLLAHLAGVQVAGPLALFGMIDWGASAVAAGWGRTACFWGPVGRVAPLPPGSWAVRRTFLPLAQALHRAPPDIWRPLRGTTLAEAATVFDATRDFWLLQTLDALTRSDLDEVLD